MTFPVRANLLTNDKEASATLFRRLLSVAPSNPNGSEEGDERDDLSTYTLTVWSSPTDDVDPADLASFIRLIGKFRYACHNQSKQEKVYDVSLCRVYLDVPAELKKQVRELLKD